MHHMWTYIRNRTEQCLDFRTANEVTTILRAGIGRNAPSQADRGER